MRKNLSNKQVKIALLALLAGSSCGGDEPGTETGFHEKIPGSFNYFVHSAPCSSTNLSGDTCTFVYDDQGRASIDLCAGVEVSYSYTDTPLTRTTTIDDLSTGDWDTTYVEEYVLENDLLVSKTTTTYTDIDVPHTSEPTVRRVEYVRDSEHVTTQATYFGQIAGVQDYSYNAETGFLERVVFENAGSTTTFGLPSDWEYTWDLGELSEVRMINIPENLTYGVTSYRYSYDEEGRYIRLETVNVNGEIDSTTYNYDCQ